MLLRTIAGCHSLRTREAVQLSDVLCHDRMSYAATRWACVFARMVTSPAGKSGQASRHGPLAEGTEGRKKRQRMQGPLVYMPSQLPEQLLLLLCVQRTRLQVMHVT